MKKMIKRADGSYSQRGLWDNIRANKGSGKEPTKEMLKQEKMIKSKKYQTAGAKLTEEELEALAHQKRGMGQLDKTFVKKAGSGKNELGKLTDDQLKQLGKYMSERSTSQKIYEALPNFGRMFGNSAADIPANSPLQKQKTGGKKSSWLEESKELKFGGPTKYQTAGFDEKQAKRDAMAKELGMVKNSTTGKWENPSKTTSSQPSGSSSYLDAAASMFSKPAPVKTRTEEGGIRRKTGGKKRMGGKKC